MARSEQDTEKVIQPEAGNFPGQPSDVNGNGADAVDHGYAGRDQIGGTGTGGTIGSTTGTGGLDGGTGTGPQRGVPNTGDRSMRHTTGGTGLGAGGIGAVGSGIGGAGANANADLDVSAGANAGDGDQLRPEPGVIGGEPVGMAGAVAGNGIMVGDLAEAEEADEQ